MVGPRNIPKRVKPSHRDQEESEGRKGDGKKTMVGGRSGKG